MDQNPMPHGEKEDKDQYRLSCASCGTASGLEMYAIRKDGSPKIVGWLFGCPLHVKDIKGANPAELFA